jgi:hypothetical protein
LSQHHGFSAGRNMQLQRSPAVSVMDIHLKAIAVTPSRPVSINGNPP